MTTFSTARIQHCLRQGQLAHMFIEELGWDRPGADLDVEVDGVVYRLAAIAQKRGVQVFECRPGAGGGAPDSAIRQKIERRVTKSAFEHLIVFTNADRTHQVWQWVLRQPGQPARYREHDYRTTQSGEPLVQKLREIRFALSDEEELDITGVVRRMVAGFDRDKVTKRFYEQFQREHRAFLGFIEGILTTADREWYASLMLNRLMFVYFIQQKGFLDGDQRYLQNRLERVRAGHGPGQFHSFYRLFLRRLFHEGFGQQVGERAADLGALIGAVPYLNGGLFEPHQLEEQYPEIDVPDEAFEKLFAFFDQWTWHLDDRPLANDREINPDVLGYIFEKYINQKQMGAYYTKEDITGYICRSTIVPHLLDDAKKECAIAFGPDGALWRLLRDNPDAYIFEPVRRGVVDGHGEVIPESALPDFVQQGMHDPKARMHDRRYNLGDADLRGDDGRTLTLPTETWREYVVRRERCLALRAKLSAGEVVEVNDLVTHNLDVRQFIQDAISTSEGPELLRAFHKATMRVTVLDPTCGSGAFLFAALNILEPVYEACLDRMRGFVDDLEGSSERHSPKKYEDFKRTLADVARHPSPSYFIFKSIIVNNLYGVDIMEEAVEICKLRLFLKLVSQVDRVGDLEPLPDIDFNVRAGNTLVGYVTVDEVRRAAEKVAMPTKADGTAIQSRMLDTEADTAIRAIEEEAEVVGRAYEQFHVMQSEHDMPAGAFAKAKVDLRGRLRALAGKLDRYLAREYGVDAADAAAFERWRKSHEPFHWVTEFYGIMQDGGFDVIVGNPPYVMYAPRKLGYAIQPRQYQTEDSRNLYAFVFERSIELATRDSPVGLIVQLTSLSSEKLVTLQNLLVQRGKLLALPFPRRPESMFDGVEMPVAILLSFSDTNRSIVTSRVGRIYGDERPAVLSIAATIAHNTWIDGHRIAKFGRTVEISIANRILSEPGSLDNLLTIRSNHFVYYQEACRYWLKATVGAPHFKRNGITMNPPHGRYLALRSAISAEFLACLLNSSLFYWYYSVFSDCEHVNDRLVRKMRVPDSDLHESWHEHWNQLSQSLTRHSTRKTIMTQQGHFIEYDEMKALWSKGAIDAIDTLLAAHYGFTDEELDFIINYDIKYRMGRDAATSEDVTT